MKSRISRAFLLLLSIVMLNSCEEDELVSTNKVVKDDAVSLKNGFLVFSDYSSFLETKKNVIELPENELLLWEKSIGQFESQRSIYHKASVLDLNHKTQLEALVNAGEREVEEILEKNEHIASYVKENQRLFNFNEDGSFDLKIEGYDPYIAYFINKDGVIQIGDSIFHYSEGFIKIIKDGDERKLHNIQKFDNSNEQEKVIVIKVEYSKYLLGKEAGINASFDGNANCTGYSSGGGQRVQGYAITGRRFTNDIYYQYGCHPGIVMTQPYAYLKAVNQIKGLFGWTNKSTSQLRIDGTVSWSAPDYGFSGQQNVLISSGIDNSSTLAAWLFDSGTWFCYTGDIYLSGSVTFKGRHGSTCSL